MSYSPPECLSPGDPVATNEEGEPEFPTAELMKLDEMINRPRWVVPVLPQGELEVLLEATINLCKKGSSLFFILERLLFQK